jgi:hypothetical protein
MPQKIKVNIKERLNRVVHLDTIEDGFRSGRTLSNYRAILNKINNHYGWDIDTIHYDEMSRNAKEIAEILKKEYALRNHESLKQKLGSLSSLMTRTKLGDEHGIKQLHSDAVKLVKIDTVAAKWDVPDWINDLHPKLVALGNDGDRIKNIIAKIYGYGYVMRIGTLFDTKLVDDGITNFLDLKNCIWHIRHQKNGEVMEFDVNPKLCKELATGRTWLLAKQDGRPYNRAAKILKYHKWDLADCATIRKSFETWNVQQSGNSLETQLKWHKILGHSRRTVLSWYNQ